MICVSCQCAVPAARANGACADRGLLRRGWSFVTNTPRETHVVTCFLLRREGGVDRVLLVRRSDRVGTYRGAWAGVSGFVEPGVTPLEQAYTELREEARLGPVDLQLLRTGAPLDVRDEAIGRAWVVHPFLFLLRDPECVRTDWEAADAQWVAPAAVTTLDTVPRLVEALAAVYPPECLNP
jgi:8-oxo-dGTP diphosphatase